MCVLPAGRTGRGRQTGSWSDSTAGRVWVHRKLLLYWDFHTQPSLGFTENTVVQEKTKRKYLERGSCVDDNTLLMSKVRGPHHLVDEVRDECADWLELIKKKATIAVMTTCYTRVVRNPHSSIPITSNTEADELPVHEKKSLPGAIQKLTAIHTGSNIAWSDESLNFRDGCVWKSQVSSFWKTSLSGINIQSHLNFLLPSFFILMSFWCTDLLPCAFQIFGLTTN